MTAEFYVQDTFGKSLANIARVREVGFNPNAGPGGGIIQPGMMSGGFDVVSMMFALHYSYENHELAKGMLKNVAGALKKGGRFIGVMPNSDVISATVKKLLQAESKGQTPNGKAHPVEAKVEKEGSEDGEVEEEDDWDPEHPSEPNGTTTATADDDDDWDPEKPSEPPPVANGTANDEGDDWDPEKPSETATLAQVQADSTTPAQTSTSPASNLPPLEWGNSLYTVRFPRAQPLTNLPLPKDGIFRPPYGWRYHYQLEEAVDVPEYVVPWEAFRALAEEYGLELMYRKGFKEVLDEIWGEGMDASEAREAKELAMLAERMGVLSRDRTEGKGGLLVGDEEMEAASFYHAFCFYKT
jgi:mRNA (guanine-N7-)-methyltransferase